VLVIILGVQGLVRACCRSSADSRAAVSDRSSSRINVLVGLLLLGSPIAAALAVPVVFGVLLLIQGVGLIVLAFRVRT